MVLTSQARDEWPETRSCVVATAWHERASTAPPSFPEYSWDTCFVRKEDGQEIRSLRIAKMPRTCRPPMFT